jgi:hypothetical protein
MSNPRRHTLSRIGQIALELGAPDGDGDPLREHLSCVVASPDGRTLWLTSDETATVERLRLSAEGASFADHARFSLRDHLALPGAQDEEADIEGLALRDGYLWAVGSHSLARWRPKKADDDAAALARLTEVRLGANRFLFGRIPLENADPDASTLVDKARTPDGGKLRPGRLPIAGKPKQLKAAAARSALTAAVCNDAHFGRFLDVPAKENGFDIEGIVVLDDRIFVGLRGPVLRGHATILEIAVAEGKRGALALAAVGEDGTIYRKHFLKLDGLGIRSLMAHGDDILILAGPTMDLDGPVRIYAWRRGASSSAPRAAGVYRGEDVGYVGDLPFGDGDDHAEGMTLLRLPRSTVANLLVVYDGPAQARLRGDHGVLADLFALPGV